MARNKLSLWIVQACVFGLLATMTGCGPLDTPYVPDYRNSFEGFDSANRRVRLQIFTTAASQGQSTGTVDETTSSVAIEDPPNDVNRNLTVAGTFDGKDMTLTFSSASSPLGSSFKGTFTDDDTIQLRDAASNAVVLTLRRTGNFTANITGNWNGTDNSGQPWLIQLGLAHGYYSDDPSSALIGTEIRNGRASRITGFLSVRSVQLRIERSSGTVRVDGQFPVVGGTVNGNSVDFGSSGSVTRGGTPDSQRLVYVLGTYGTGIASADLKGNQITTVVDRPNFTDNIYDMAVAPGGAAIAYGVCRLGCNLYVYRKSTGQGIAITSMATNTLNLSGVVSPSLKWSPDGSQLAFVMQETVNGPFNVYVMRLDTLQFTKISGATAYLASSAWVEWSPASSTTPTLAYYALAAGSSTRVDLYTRRMDGASAAVLITTGGATTRRVVDLRWSPDGNRLAFVGNLLSSGINELFIASPTGGVFTAGGYVAAAPQPAPAGMYASELEWSPNGARIAFMSNSTLYTASSVTGSMVNVANLPGGPYSGQSVVDFSWSPDSSKLAFEAYTSTTATAPRLYVVNGSGGSTATEVAAVAGNTGNLAWNTDGSRISYARMHVPFDYMYDFWSVKPDGTGAAMLQANGSSYCDYPATRVYRQQLSWSPDARSAAIVATADVTTSECSLYVVNPDGSGSHALRPLGGQQLQIGEFRWLTDSTRVLYDIRDPSFNARDEGLYIGYAADSASLKVSGALGELAGASWISAY
jgi:Tol biopolymer transport system component